MIGDRWTAVPIWQHEGLSFCQWVGSKVKPKVCESVKCVDCNCLKCSELVQEDSKCSCVVCSICSNTENKQPINCKCLEYNCTQHFADLCSKFNDWTCLKCAKDYKSSSDVCENCKCFTVSCSKPLTCPTYEMKVSNNLRNIAQFPGCPDNVLCCTCSEDQCVNCCCHYVFCNRCGDPVFGYDNTVDVCTFRQSNCCSFLFQSLFCLPRFLCLGCFGLCENFARCCYFTCLNCAYLVCCECTDGKFCMNYACLCFDCEKRNKSPQANSDDDVDGYKYACCIYMPGNPPSILNADIEIPESDDYDSLETVRIDGAENTLPTRVERSPENLNAVEEKLQFVDEKKVRPAKCFNEIDLARKGSVDVKKVSPAKSFNQMNPIRKKSEKKTQPRRKHLNKVPIGEYHAKSKYRDVKSDTSEEETAREYHTKAGNLVIESDTSDEEESYQAVKHMRRLQGELLRNDCYGTDSEEIDVENATSVHRKLKKYSDDQYDQHSENRRRFDFVQKSIHTKDIEDRNKCAKPGILKTRNSYFSDAKNDSRNTEAFSIYNENWSGEHLRSKKRAHFANDDEDLIKELFPQQLLERTAKGARGTNRTRKVKQNRISEEAKNDTPKQIDTSPDESEIIANVSTSRKTPRMGKRRMKSRVKSHYDSSEDDEMDESSHKTYRHVLSTSNSSGSGIKRSQKKIKMNNERKKVSFENSGQSVEVQLFDYNSSEEEFAAERRKSAKDEMQLEDLDNLSDQAVMDNKMDKKNKSISQRLKEMKQRRSLSELESD